MPADQEPERGNESAAQAIEMLKAVVDGATYDAVAARFGVTRTAVERRIKAVAVRLSKTVGIEGLNTEGVAFVQRLRQHRESILVALAGFEPLAPFGPRQHRVVSSEEITQAALRIKARSARPWHDQSLFYMLFATGARPLEIARLEVRDYLGPDGSVRRVSELRAEAAITGKSRPLYFTSTRLDDALAAYLRERIEQGLGIAESGDYRAWIRGAACSCRRPDSASPSTVWRRRAAPLPVPSDPGGLSQAFSPCRPARRDAAVGAAHRRGPVVRTRRGRRAGGPAAGHQRPQRGARTVPEASAGDVGPGARTGVTRRGRDDGGHPTFLHPGARVERGRRAAAAGAGPRP
ncbi:hypothetical protein [Methylibium sp. T29]|uniref:hypothetical protein n=1 Tax=Methylibium sp. T29 TaxID=1430884 RepID=UPI0004B5628D|nr:hypothetical protein [Methylibium sp. T29]